MPDSARLHANHMFRSRRAPRIELTGEEHKPTKTRISRKWRQSRNSQNKEQQTKMQKTRITQRSRQKKRKSEKQKSRTKPRKQK